MRATFRLLLLPGLLLAGATLALAQQELGDPIAPAVIGRPLDQIRPHRAHDKPAKAARGKQADARTAAASKASRSPAPKGLALRPTTGVTPASFGRDRADPSIVDDVGQGTHFARKPLAPGVYFGDRHRTAVRKYYEEHPLAGGPAQWKIGEPVPRGAALSPVPQGLLASLPKLPPGHEYVQLNGEVVMIAAGSKMVVDGISRAR